MQKNSSLIIHTDGGSRGNPGPAACAFVVDQNRKEIFSRSKFLGQQTNNHAEYSGVLLALEWVSNQLSDHSTLRPIVFYLDSELVVKQINGLYKVKDQNLRKLFSEVMEKIELLSVKVSFQHIPRGKNRAADFLVNQELDSKS